MLDKSVTLFAIRMPTSSNNYVFTHNNYTEKDIEYYASLDCKCIQYGKEIAPQSGTPHLQGWVSFKTKTRPKRARKLFPGAFIEMMKGSIEQNVTYCSKEQGEKYTRGDLPQEKKKNGANEKRRWEDAFESAKSGDLDDIPAEMRIRFYSTFKKIKGDLAERPKDLEGDEDLKTGVWYYGTTGTGKSRDARRQYGDSLYVKDCNKWWDDYDGEKYVLIDDLDPDQKFMRRFIKTWTDRYVFPAQKKGGNAWCRPKLVIITSQYTIDEIWEDEPTRSAMKRRFTVVHMLKAKKKASSAASSDLPPWVDTSLDVARASPEAPFVYTPCFPSNQMAQYSPDYPGIY